MKNVLEVSLIFCGGAFIGYLGTSYFLNKSFKKELNFTVDGLIDEYEKYIETLNSNAVASLDLEEEEDIKEFKTLINVYDEGLKVKGDEIVTTVINNDEEVVENVFDNVNGPYLIPGDKFLEDLKEDAPYDKVDLYYYEDDQILTDTKDKIIENQEKFVGDTLLHFKKTDEDAIYVRNDALLTDYEVLRFHDSYSSAILGIDEDK